MPDSANLSSLADALSKASYQLSLAVGYPAIAAALAEVFGTGAHLWLGLNMSKPDADLIEINFLARSQNGQAESISQAATFSLQEADAAAQAAFARKEGFTLLRENCKGTLRGFLDQQKAVALAFYPLQQEGECFGVALCLATSTPAPLSLAEQQLRQIVIDQAAARMQTQMQREQVDEKAQANSKMLLQESQRMREIAQQSLWEMEESLDEVNRLYGVSKAILGAKNVADVVGALREHIAPGATFIEYVNILYDDKGSLLDARLEYLLRPEEEGKQIQVSLKTVCGDALLTRMVAYLSKATLGFDVVEDSQESPTSPMLEFAQVQDIRSLVTFPIFWDGRMSEFISIAYIYPTEVDDPAQRLYSSINDQIRLSIQAQRLLNITQQNADALANRVHILESINRLAYDIANLSSEEQLIESAAEMLVRLAGFDHCGVLRIDPFDAAFGVLMSEYPPSEAKGARLRMIQPKTPSRDQHSPDPIIVPYLRTSELFEESDRQTLLGFGIESLVIFPLVVNGRRIGNVGLDMYTQRGIPPFAIESAQVITAQLNVAIQTHELIRETRQRAEQLQEIAAMGQVLQPTMERKAILNVVLQECQRLFSADDLMVALGDPVSNDLLNVLSFSDSKVNIDPESRQTIPMTADISSAWNEWEEVYIPDSRDVNTPVPVPTNIRCMVTLPMMARGQAIGVARLGNIRPNAYSTTDRAVLQQMLNQVAAILESQDALVQSRRSAQSKSVVNEISNQLQRQLDIAAMLDVTAQQLGQALGAKRARIRLGSINLDEGQ